MCVRSRQDAKSPPAGLVAAMLDIQKHRGPDGEGIFVADGICLGHRRLAVLDPSDAGRQPMTSRDGRWTITFNGEVFNYLEIRKDLRGSFRTGTDTEVLLEACARWGVERALQATVGMFGFGLWDAQERALWLARDRMGEKPLVYFWDGQVFAFASELKALAPFHQRRLDPSAVDTYFALGYVPAPMAIFRGCRKLAPGYLLRLRAGAEPEVTRWWQAQPLPVNESPAPDRCEALREQTGNAVRLRLRADVPVALCLSGGVDSSVVAAECVRQGVRMDAFTVRFDGDDTDLPYAKHVASHLALPHEVVEASGPALAQNFERIVWHYDEPFADSSALPCFALARSIGGRYKVVLTGDGGDEAFGGYRHYERIAVKQWVKAAAAAAGVCDGRGSGRPGVYVESKAAFSGSERAKLLRDVMEQREIGSSLRALLREGDWGNGQADTLKRALAIDRHLHLANGLNYKTEIAFAASGMEGRAPFLDHRLMDWSISLPSSDLVSGTQKKVLLKKAYGRDLPAAVLRRRKHGFGAPVKKWLEGPFRELAREVLPCGLLSGSDPQTLKGQQQWTVLSFAAWARRWRATW